ncbi:MAG: ABC transporter permease [Patescibacteria group bacterium]
MMRKIDQRVKLAYLWYWLEFLGAMTTKEIKARYKHAVFGFLWMILNPILQMLVIGLVFQFFVPIKVDNYFLFLFSGLLPWNFFSMSVTKTVQVFYYERSLIQKAKFPVEALPLSIILSNLFHKCISLAIFLIILGAMGFASFKWLFLGPLLIWLLLLTSGISLLLATLNVKYRDIAFFVDALIPLWFYITPVIYSMDLVPDFLSKWMALNPVFGVINSFRWVLLGEELNKDSFLVGILITLLIFFLGAFVFHVEKKYFDDWL